MEFDELRKTIKDLSTILATIGAILSVLLIFYKEIRPFLVNSKQSLKIESLQSRLDKSTKPFIALSKIKRLWKLDTSSGKEKTLKEIVKFLSSMDVEILNIDLNNARIKLNNALGNNDLAEIKKEFNLLVYIYKKNIENISLIFESKQKKYKNFFGKIL